MENWSMKFMTENIFQPKTRCVVLFLYTMLEFKTSLVTKWKSKCSRGPIYSVLFSNTYIIIYKQIVFQELVYTLVFEIQENTFIEIILLTVDSLLRPILPCMDGRLPLPIIAASLPFLYFFLISFFCFRIVLDLQKIWKESSYIPHIQFPQLLTSYTRMVYLSQLVSQCWLIHYY